MLLRVARILSGAILGVIATLFLSTTQAQAYTVSPTTTIRPVSTVDPSQWLTTGTSNGDCIGNCGFVNEVIPNETTNYVRTANVMSDTYGLGNATNSGGQTASQIVVNVSARKGTILADPVVTVNLTIGGQPQVVQTLPSLSGSVFTTYPLTFTAPNGGWSQSAINSSSITISKTNASTLSAAWVSTIWADVTYQNPTLTQSNFRFYENADSLTPGAALAAADTAGEINTNTSFRLRMGIKAGDIGWTTGSWGDKGNSYKLQYAKLAVRSSCSSPSGWNNVTTSSEVRWKINNSTSNGATINGDTFGVTTPVYENYQDGTTGVFTNNVPVANGSTGIWDFSLSTSGIAPGSVLCFRIVNSSDSSTLTSYVTYPQLTVTGDFIGGIVDSSGNPVSSAVATFSNIITATASCNVATATLGLPSQIIRVTNDLKQNGWNVTLAATDGPNASWSSGAANYDYNDSNGSGCTDGGDGDPLSGQLTVDPLLAKLTATSTNGCDTTGISKGNSASFVEGVGGVDPITDITLMSATSSSQRFCYFDLTGVNLSQTIPQLTQPGTYSLDMTLTFTAH